MTTERIRRHKSANPKLRKSQGKPRLTTIKSSSETKPFSVTHDQYLFSYMKHNKMPPSKILRASSARLLGKVRSAENNLERRSTALSSASTGRQNYVEDTMHKYSTVEQYNRSNFLKGSTKHSRNKSGEGYEEYKTNVPLFDVEKVREINSPQPKSCPIDRDTPNKDDAKSSAYCFWDTRSQQYLTLCKDTPSQGRDNTSEVNYKYKRCKSARHIMAPRGTPICLSLSSMSDCDVETYLDDEKEQIDEENEVKLSDADCSILTGDALSSSLSIGVSSSSKNINGHQPKTYSENNITSMDASTPDDSISFTQGRT